MNRWTAAAGIVAMACMVHGCALFGGGIAPCEKPQMYQDAEPSDPLVAAEGLETPQAFGNLEIPEGEVQEGQPKRSNGSCLEEPPEIQKPGSG